MKINWQKIGFALVALVGTASVFFVSWFWRLLLIPIILVIVYDLISSFLMPKK